VTQHPLDGTMEDFWRMVWDQNSSVIVQLSSVDEEVRCQCMKLAFIANSPNFCIAVLTSGPILRPKNMTVRPKGRPWKSWGLPVFQVRL